MRASARTRGSSAPIHPFCVGFGETATEMIVLARFFGGLGSHLHFINLVWAKAYQDHNVSKQAAKLSCHISFTEPNSDDIIQGKSTRIRIFLKARGNIEVLDVLVWFSSLKFARPCQGQNHMQPASDILNCTSKRDSFSHAFAKVVSLTKRQNERSSRDVTKHKPTRTALFERHLLSRSRIFKHIWGLMQQMQGSKLYADSGSFRGKRHCQAIQLRSSLLLLAALTMHNAL